jgi:hypothetical protein
MTEPFVKIVRRVVIERHVRLATFIIVGVWWIVATLAKIQLCLRIGVQLCR